MHFLSFRGEKTHYVFSGIERALLFSLTPRTSHDQGSPKPTPLTTRESLSHVTHRRPPVAHRTGTAVSLPAATRILASSLSRPNPFFYKLKSQKSLLTILNCSSSDSSFKVKPSSQIRKTHAQINIDVYIIPSQDAHQQTAPSTQASSSLCSCSANQTESSTFELKTLQI